MELREGIVVADRFRLVKMIGRGGMGSVWQAQHLGLDTACALKFIEGELALLAEAHARFEREARAAAQLRSPHVVQIMDHGVWQGLPYIAMELLDGEDLGKRLGARGGRLSPSEIATVMQQVCRALSKAHAAGVVHRDLKPDNIFLVRDDDREIVKILDFGVAKSKNQALDGSNTKTGAMLGTPYYMSPEQAQGIRSVDSRSDLWSLAVIVFQALTGRLPFESEALGDLLVKIIVSPIPRPSTVYGNLPPGFDSWWAKAADRNPDLRFQTAKELSDSLQLALDQSSITDVLRVHVARSSPGVAATQVMPPPSTPFPAPLHTAQMQTPANAPFYQPTPPNFQPHQTPPPYANAGFGASPAHTFGGVEPASAMPAKKQPPVALFVGVGLLALAGLGLGGFTMLSAKKRVADTRSDDRVSASAGVSSALGDDLSHTAPATSAGTAVKVDNLGMVASAAPSSAAADPRVASSAAAAKPTVKPILPTPVVSQTPPIKSAAPIASKPEKHDLGF